MHLVGAGDLFCKVKMLMEGTDASCAAAAARSGARASLGLAPSGDGVALRFASNGNGVAAAVVTIAAAKTDVAGVDWQLPAGFTSASHHADGLLTLVVYSASLAALPDRDLATIRLSSGAGAVSLRADANSLGGVDGASVPVAVEAHQPGPRTATSSSCRLLPDKEVVLCRGGVRMPPASRPYKRSVEALWKRFCCRISIACVVASQQAIASQDVCW